MKYLKRTLIFVFLLLVSSSLVACKREKTKKYDVRTIKEEKGTVVKTADLEKPEPREGYTFGGWYTTKRGQTWFEKEPVKELVATGEEQKLYAFWIPNDSKAVDYSDGETYKNSFTDMNQDPILNPLVYRWSHENTLISYLRTPLFAYDVDWDQAIKNDLATKPGDFSKLNEKNIGSILRQRILVGAQEFPVIVEGEDKGENGTLDGKYNEIHSGKIKGTKYRYTIRDDIFWEDGEKVTAKDYFYTYLQYIDGDQNNFRSEVYVPTASRNSGYRIVNARNYFLQGKKLGISAGTESDYSKYKIFFTTGPDAAYGENMPISSGYMTEEEFKNQNFDVANLGVKTSVKDDEELFTFLKYVKKVNWLQEYAPKAREIEKDKKVVKQSDLYTLNEAIKVAEEVANNKDATEEELKEAFKNLKAELESFNKAIVVGLKGVAPKEVLTKVIADATALKDNAVEVKELPKAKDLEKDKVNAKKESLDALALAIQEAQKVLDNKEATEEELEEAITELNTAVETFNEVVVVGTKEAALGAVDKKALEEAIANAKQAQDGIVANEDKRKEKNFANLNPQFRFETNEYYIGEKGTTAPEVKQEELGFKVIDDHTFELTFEVPTEHQKALTVGDVSLVHKESYEKGMNKEKTGSEYGTSKLPPLSYGPYVIKSWDSMQKIVLNKNYKSFQHVNFNYKAISFEFMDNVDSRMKAFKSGKLDVTGLNQKYFSEYANDKRLKYDHMGHGRYFILNAVDYKGREKDITSVMKDLDFRKALMYGFNRKDFVNTTFSPHLASLFHLPINAVQYDNDPQWYTQTDEYKKMVEEAGYNLDSAGYDAKKAKDHFEKAYKRWQEKGNTGPMKIRYLAAEGAESERIDNYILKSYTELFGKDKIEFVVDRLADKPHDDKQNGREFDLVLSSIGTGEVTNTSVEAPILGIYYSHIYGGSKWGFNSLEELGVDPEATKITKENKLDLKATYEFLKEKFEEDAFDDKTDDGTLWPLWEILKANEGYFVGDLAILVDYGAACTFMWAGTAPQYDGDVKDRNTVTRAFDKLNLDYAAIIPVASLRSGVVYSDNIVIEWPAYHNILGWGQARYRYLKTDQDFQ